MYNIGYSVEREGENMRLFKKCIITAILLLAVILPVSSFASGESFSCVKVHFILADIPTMIEETAVFELYDETGQNLLDRKSHSLIRNEKWFDIEFSVPEYPIGTKFKFVVSEGATGAVHSGVKQDVHILETYCHPDENGDMHYQTSFYMEILPLWNKEAVIRLPGETVTRYYHCLTEDEVYVTLDLMEKLGIKHTLDMDGEKPSATLYSEDGSAVARFYLNDIYAGFGENGENLAIPTFEIGGWPYFPLSRVAEYFNCNYTLVTDNEYMREITLTRSEYAESFKQASYINSLDIDSRTDYLIWVSKKDFTVNTYVGTKGKWHLVKSARCAIGAPKTPTVEGSFEYHQYQPRWTYDGYYCGPIMRFYNGYALHSTLIRFDGRFYDNRVGARISHGCVRLRPEDINWLAENIPLNTRVLVTK